MSTKDKGSLQINGVEYHLPLVLGEPDEVPCQVCPAICCQYFALNIDKPTCKAEFENIRWYLLHRAVHVFVENDKWYLQVWNPCRYLEPDNRCGIYSNRPKICQDYGKDYFDRVNCHAVSTADEEYGLIFRTPEELEAYYAEWYARRYGWRTKTTRKKTVKK